MSFLIRFSCRFRSSFAGPAGAGRLLKLAEPYGLALWLLTVLPIVSHSPGHAGWVAVEKRYQPPSTQTVYFDPDTIRQEGNRATLWQLADIKWIDGTPTPRFLSAKTHKQFDCARLRFRVLEIVEYSRQMASGKSRSGYIENGNWQPVESRTVDHALWETACKKK
jgi:hypothetical protein